MYYIQICIYIYIHIHIYVYIYKHNISDIYASLSFIHPMFMIDVTNKY